MQNPAQNDTNSNKCGRFSGTSIDTASEEKFDIYNYSAGDSLDLQLSVDGTDSGKLKLRAYRADADPMLVRVVPRATGQKDEDSPDIDTRD